MIDFKDKIAEQIASITKLDKNELYEYIEMPSDNKMGDYAFPCFKLAKSMRKSPQIIANELKDGIILSDEFEKIEVVNGYINFFINNKKLIENILNEVEDKKEKYGSNNIGQGKNIVIDYSSPNIAKPFHIGHLRTTILGNSLYKMYKFLNYNCIGVNHLGDWGTQFAKLIEGYKRWGTEYDVENNPIEELTKIYIRINDLCKEDESVLEQCRDNFKKLEDGDEYCVSLWQKFRDLSLKEFQRIYDLLDIQFDSWNGEAFYTDKMPEVKEILEKNNKLVESEGAKVVDLSDKDMPPCIIEKSNGSTTYATRDLAAILYRARTYDFDKDIYVTSYEQILHFKQVFETAKYLDLDEKYTNGLVHVPYGMVMLKTGKMSTRDGNVIYINDLINEAIEKSKNIILSKNPNSENVDKLSKQIGVGALIFNYLKSGENKDIIFDLDETLRFDGETGPYIQYTYVRTKSLLEKAKFNIENIDVNDLKLDMLTQVQEVQLIKELEKFTNVIKKASDEYKPSILARYLIDIATLFSKFYNECSVINLESDELKKARCTLVYATSIVIKNGLKILGIECPDKM